MGIVASTNVSFKKLYQGTSWGQSTSTIADVSTNKQYAIAAITHLRNQFGIEYDASNPINGTQGTEWKASQTIGLYTADGLVTQGVNGFLNGHFGVTGSYGYGSRYNPNSVGAKELNIDGEVITYNGQTVLVDDNFSGIGYYNDGGSTQEFRMSLETTSAGAPPADIISSIIIQISGNAAVTGNGQQDSFKLDFANAATTTSGNTRVFLWDQTAFGDNTAFTNFTGAWDGSGDMFIAYVA